ncbi:MAG: DUF4352 domain-containing protein [Clostridioides sp.]|nr:DUF4352 domain-containing protein [Clostridioides sp.]
MKKSLFIVLIIILGVSFTGCNNSTNSNQNSDNENENTEEVYNDTTKAKEEAEEKEKFIGEHGKAEEFDLVVNSIKETNRIDDEFSYYEAESGKYLVINITLNNNSNDSGSISNSDFKVEDSNGAEYVSSTLIHDDFMSWETINPHLEKTTNLAFEIPSDANINEFKLKYHTFTSKETDCFILREK